MARISDDVRAAVVADLRRTIGTEDGSVRKVAARHALSTTSIRRIATVAGVTFAPESRAQTLNARMTNTLTNAQRREALSERMLARAEALERSLDESCYVYSFGGQFGAFTDAHAQRPSPADAKHLMTAAGIAVDKHERLEKFDSAGAAGQQADLLLRLLTGQGPAPTA